MRENCTSGSMRGSGRPTLHAASLPLSTLPDNIFFRGRPRTQRNRRPAAEGVSGEGHGRRAKVFW